MATILVARTKIKIMHFSHFLFIWHVFIHVLESRHANGVHNICIPQIPHAPTWIADLSRCQCIFQGGTLPEDVYTHFPLEVPYGPPGSLGSSYVSYVMFSESSHVGLSPARCAECSPSLLAITIWARKVPERRTRELFKCTLYMSKLCPE